MENGERDKCRNSPELWRQNAFLVDLMYLRGIPNDVYWRQIAPEMLV
jgi:hypothetical protein